MYHLYVGKNIKNQSYLRIKSPLMAIAATLMYEFLCTIIIVIITYTTTKDVT